MHLELSSTKDGWTGEIRKIPRFTHNHSYTQTPQTPPNKTITTVIEYCRGPSIMFRTDGWKDGPTKLGVQTNKD